MGAAIKGAHMPKQISSLKLITANETVWDAVYRTGTTYRIIGQAEAYGWREFNKRINRFPSTFYFSVWYRLRFQFVPPFFPLERLNGQPLFCLCFIRRGSLRADSVSFHVTSIEQFRGISPLKRFVARVESHIRGNDGRRTKVAEVCFKRVLLYLWGITCLILVGFAKGVHQILGTVVKEFHNFRPPGIILQRSVDSSSLLLFQ